MMFSMFFFNDTATTEIYTLSLHDALPISGGALGLLLRPDEEEAGASAALTRWRVGALPGTGSSAHDLGDPRWRLDLLRCRGDRKSTRLNSSHANISYAVFCLKKKDTYYHR